MPMTVEQIEQFIKEAIPDASVEIEDLKGDGDHYSATVTSKSFSGNTPHSTLNTFESSMHFSIIP